MIKISSGIYKGYQLKINYRNKPRPTMSKTRLGLFNIIRDRIKNATLLDAFAGSGIIGFEALSLEAKKVVFLEQDFLLFNSLKKNIKNLKANAEVYVGDTLKLMKKIGNKDRYFDFIYLDPPYSDSLLQNCFETCLTFNLIKKTGMIICERHKNYSIFYNKNNICHLDSRKYSGTIIDFFTLTN